MLKTGECESLHSLLLLLTATYSMLHCKEKLHLHQIPIFHITTMVRTISEKSLSPLHLAVNWTV